ncbi:hypothetical protein CCAX7_58140 [Capsulimonas corticalis]|uniref:Uncharacterized protein n=1 Tax=Capsulimonas corticalis TaxID=2219043 RepID=A0A402D007_9BACT|nr:DUF72 domain-containing protein [Capsulimonas corticalis]BDI33763.1 hypothetical protein CCAX7_58140 [Capsulimonas corticalis]
MSIHIGTSGWSYDHWRGVLYPEGSPASKRLAYYVERFQTVEVNSSYYHWPRDTTFAGWRDKVPPGFVMTIKAPRGLTHAARLKSPEVWLERIEQGLRELGDKRGPLLVQLPPDMEIDLPRLAYFLERTPKGLRVCVEFRHPSWNTNEAFALLERYGAAYCVMSGAHLPCILRATAMFAYVRLHGPDQEYLYGGSYSDRDLRWWADRIREWAEGGLDVYAYFNNDGGGNAVRNAETLKAILHT